MPEQGSQAILPRTPDVPATLEEAIHPDWLTAALTPLSGGAPVESVELAEVIRTMASKVRIRVRFRGDATLHDYCLKAFLGEPGLGGGQTTIREGRFYTDIAPHTTMRLPHVPAVILDEEKGQGILIMEDMIAAGARFCSALEPFTVELAQQSLDQLARLHSRPDIAARTDWLPTRIDVIANKPHFAPEKQQELLDHPRNAGLPDRTRSGALLHAGMKALSARNAARPRTLLHGDCHAGNLFLIDGAPGFTDWQLVQRGHWAMDVAYHLCAVLPVEMAERHERDLLDSYLASVREHGGEAPDRDAAWEDYRAAQIYGFYHWAITTRVDPAIIAIFMERLGAGVTRHDSYTVLGL
ncbi:aminoglycoside phosphotransferase family protein [Sphingobium sufflavum]|uniref:aminoglycoside phosphotransferase family protein n=1 Tax=Sphingobium sufflavum TaxID=1129547 RepID=UPI001F39E953|nr:aminoglycoside phosphotransferase family protein [Sphingobium sufflavum]MCE7795434.1 aminoglycoside phosphotransferase family protein [Sphingobium sufflavum]